MNGHEDRKFHLEITGMETFAAFVALIRGDGIPTPEELTHLRREAEKLKAETTKQTAAVTANS